ncbi:hypothetical protein Glove_13g160 [Diversispora epigaea]|uniref:Uncharacterized protein n=1 Tax=Diversispora epigaea TaxID=1348612 RepID=A0A397JM90_9GLOM|nr:hypothetical protein Glove_13g160 [Diversispora epigaea]
MQKKTKTNIGSPITNNSNENFYIYHCSNCGARETEEIFKAKFYFGICTCDLNLKVKNCQRPTVGSDVEIRLVN